MPTLELNLSQTALVIIDLQKAVVAMATEPRSPDVVIANTARMATALRKAGGFVVQVHVEPAADGKDMLKPILDVPASWGSGPRPLDFAAIVPEVLARTDHLVTKKQWGAFYGTDLDLDLQLRRRGITTIVLCGIATCFGVESTARDAYELGYQQVFVEDAMSSRSAAEHEHTVTKVFPRIGRVRSTADVLSALGA